VVQCCCNDAFTNSTSTRWWVLPIPLPTWHATAQFPLDTVAYEWGPDVFRHTISWLHNRSDGWMDDIFSNDPPGTQTVLYHAIANDNCDDTTASRAYWDLRHETNNYNTTIVKYNTTNDRNSGILNQMTVPQRMHGIVGSRCSGASIAIARLAGLEEIPQVSPVSTSARLSNDDEFPYFSRLAAPDSTRGQVGALVALLNLFGWERVAALPDLAYNCQSPKQTHTHALLDIRANSLHLRSKTPLRNPKFWCRSLVACVVSTPVS
jgi:Receptor family ligand binding region